MSTLPGLASKGEKGKSKYQSLDINNLYKVCTTEPLETQQQKNTLPRKHGMQSLGKVPTARRPPANLPSLKSEHTGSDAAVSLVPSGGAGWGKQDQNSPSTNIPGSISTTTNSNVTTSSPTTVQQNTPPTNAPPITSLPPSNKTHTTPTATPVTADKSWSSVMSGADLLQPPPYQSPQFQHEFPSLSAGDGALPRTGVDTQYGPGPSLRPQTEGSWIQGGSRSGTEVASRNNSAPLAPPPQLSVQAGQTQQPPQQPLPPQFRGLIPPFMFRGNNFPSNGHGNSNFSNVSGPVNNGRSRASDNRGSSRSNNENDDMCHRPIIKEEDLNRMDDMTRDVGWASHDDIDYNQKLAFSDDEMEIEKNRRQLSTHKEHDKTEVNLQETNIKIVKTGSNTQSQANRNRTNEEDEVWVQRRRQQSEEVAIVIERAKQRKEEEEKRFLEIRQAAAKKLQQLDEKRNKHDKEVDDNQGTINPSVVPPQPINPVPIPVPDWEKEKERSRTPVENKPQYRESPSSEFRKLTQIEGRSFQRKENRSADRDSNRERERDAPTFSKQFQSNLPPRFQKRHQMRNNPSPQPSQTSSNSFSDQYDTRWQNQIKSSNELRKRDDEIDVKDVEDNRRDTRKVVNDENYRSSYRGYTDVAHKIDENCEFEYRKDNVKQEDHNITRQNSDDSRIERFERPQRPDSRDSRTSRESRHSRESEPREYHGSWADAPFEPVFDDKRKDHFREDRRAVPGPITKERIEADDLKSEKKNLTQLKRGYIPEKRISDAKKEEQEKAEDSWEELPSKTTEKVEKEDVSNAWADAAVTNLVPENKFFEEKAKVDAIKDIEKQDEESEKIDKADKDKDDKRNINSNRRRTDPRHQPWPSACVYHRSTWSKKNDSRRGSRNGAPKKPLSGKNNEWHGTDSDVSVDEISVSTESGRDDRSLRTSKKFEKDEKNKETKQEKVVGGERKFDSNRRDNYVPRGEPSRHGRGASNFRSRGGLSKRIDGYGPPPSKSPFSQLEDRDKKVCDENVDAQIIPADKTVSEDKTKTNQVGVIGADKVEDLNKMKMTKKAKSDDNCDTSDNSEDNGLKSKRFGQKSLNSGPNRCTNALIRRNNPPPRLSTDKRSNYNAGGRQNSSGSLKSYGLPKKDKDERMHLKDGVDDIENIDGEIESSIVCDSDGFQEVKSKKTGQRQKPFEEKMSIRSSIKGEKDIKLSNKKSNSSQLTPQQIANIPSLMDTPVNPPAIAPQTSNKNQFDRSYQNRLPPRFARQRENRLQKAHMQQQGMCDVNEMNKVNHNINLYGIKDGQGSAAGRMSNAWDKPLSTHLRTEQEGILSVGVDSSKTLEQPQQPASQSNSPNIDKVMKATHVSEKTVLDGATPPVNTIIFENTNFKSAPGTRVRSEKSTKLDETGIEQAVISSFNKPMRDLLNKNEKSADSMQMQLSFAKEDNSDMKLDFFESELSHLTDDKSSKNMGRSMHITNANNSISASTADALNFKIASVKKVWETMPTVIEHSVGQDDTNSSFSASFGPDPNSLDPNAFGKGDGQDDVHEAYSTSPNQPTTNNTTNVCKVKPTQQVTGTSGQPVHSASTHQQHSGIGPSIVGHPLSPPPMQPVLGAGVGLGQPPQPYTSNQHLGYQPNLGGSTQYGMSAIPSPPTVLFNSTQQIQAQTGLYGAFQIDQSQVLGGQGRSQYSPYPNPYSLGQTASSPYSAQSMYLQGAQPHPSAPQAPPDIYQNINNYRLPATGPFGQSQQLNNPTTVLISSTSNSLMSATVKPSTQQISAIGTKASGGGQAYQQQSQQGQLYMAYDPTIQANYLPSTGVIQRGPTAPLQNNVVPALQPSSSYYTGSTGAQTGFFQQQANSTLQSASMQQHQAGYGLQGNVFGNPNQSHTSAGLQNFSSHFLSSPMQMAAAAALNAQQQYRSNNLQNSAYVKAANNHIGDQNSRPQQIKSPGSQQDVLSSVFNSGSQIPSPKSRQNMKQPPPQASPTTQHKYLYQAVGNQPPAQSPRYPSPIQRPVTFHTAMGGIPNNSGSSNKHRSTNQSNKLAGRHFYTSQGGNLSTSQSDKGDDSKLGDGTVPNSSNSIVNNSSGIVSKTVNSNSSTATVNQSDMAKETAKDDGGVIKD
ncbi:hypothetical protein RN001_004370 [Aquatica leii]|uniref:BAT2 N-terminal domain-containing protein n=1 Tax=Aquatica leii TaxID=1421715 RepID=A0AAN7PED3_9COLE|nr:hypothetical protein RN001_004370 [Aquatica leii]